MERTEVDGRLLRRLARRMDTWKRLEIRLENIMGVGEARYVSMSAYNNDA